MEKKEAVQLFGKVSELAKALGISRQAISQWPSTLDKSKSDRVIGAAVRVGRFKPLKKAA